MENEKMDCFLDVKQEFLVCTTIHKIRDLPCLNSDSYVKVLFGKRQKLTKTVQKSENPFFNEYFVFELFCSLPELLSTSIVYEIFKKSTCKKDKRLGFLTIDIKSIWNRPNHAFFKKWGRLECQDDNEKCYIQLDLNISSRIDPPAPAVFDQRNYDVIEENLINPHINETIKRFSYVVTIYKGVFVKKENYAIQVEFCGKQFKTKTKKNSSRPEWNEQLTYSSVSLCETIIFQLIVNNSINNTNSSFYRLFLGDITFSDRLPSLGPTYLHLYSLSKAREYIGRILIQFEVNIPNSSDNNNLKTSEKFVGINSINEEEFWSTEKFQLVCIASHGDFLHTSVSNIRLKITFAEQESNSVECLLKNYPEGDYKYFQQEQPQSAISLNIFLPDIRPKLETDHFLIKCSRYITELLKTYKGLQESCRDNQQLQKKCLKVILISVKKKLREELSKLENGGWIKLSTYDNNYTNFLNIFMKELMTNLENYFHQLKSKKEIIGLNSQINTFLENIVRRMEVIAEQRISDNWPDIYLSASAAGSIEAISKLNPKDYVYSLSKMCTGLVCAKRHSLILKSILCTHSCKNCGCIYGKIDFTICIGTEAEMLSFNDIGEWLKTETLYFEPKFQSFYNCNIYISQAKIHPGQDKSGLCDAMIRVYFFNAVHETSILKMSLSPIWNETISIKNICIFGSVTSCIENPPRIAIELMDFEENNSFEPVGCCIIRPSVKIFSANIISTIENNPYQKKLDFGNLMKKITTDEAEKKLEEVKNSSPPKLKWETITFKGNIFAGLLISSELIELESNNNETSVSISRIPEILKPTLASYKIEVIFVGLRHFKKPFLAVVGQYKVKLVIGELCLESGCSGKHTAESLNFLDIYATEIVKLPTQLEYWPPLILTHNSCVKGKKDITMGAAMIEKSSKYLQKEVNKPTLKTNEIVKKGFDTNTIQNEQTPLIQRKSFSVLGKTWLKTLGNLNTLSLSRKSSSSLKDDINSKKHSLVIYGTELEKQTEFESFYDWAEPVKMIRGTTKKRNGQQSEEIYCVLKCNIKITPCQSSYFSIENDDEYLSNHKESLNMLNGLILDIPIIVRIYIVQGLALRSHDTSSPSDAYIKIELGSKIVNDRPNFISNQINPIFGRMYQIEGNIPREHMLRISVYDRDIWDELIGCTTIDLEDRWQSRHLAAIGIQKEYSRSGYNIWRNNYKPSKILKSLCSKYNVDEPKFIDNKIQVGGITFEDNIHIATDEDINERLSLTVLNQLSQIPIFGFKLVPEHVETRSLYHPKRLGVEQGKLQLWIELYDPKNIPPPIDITPVPAENYELRAIIWNTKDVVLDEKNVFGSKMSDIYIKGWVDDADNAQYTDIHYRSLTGEGNFNWRMIFPIRYSLIEEMMVTVQKAAAYEIFSTEIKKPAILTLQVWDNDTFSADDFLGTLSINIANFLEPTSTSKKCSLEKRNNFVNLFEIRKCKGWFPFKGKLENETIGLTGKIELELDILTEEQAKSNPAGLGHDGPNALPQPKRPETSFNWFTNPLKSLKLIILPRIKRVCWFFLIVIICVSILIITLKLILR